jgi:hypothetical protein
VSRLQGNTRLIASLVALVGTVAVVGAADASPPPLDQPQITYVRECSGTGAAASQRRGYCQCSYQQLRRRYTLQQYLLLDGWIRSGPPELRRFAVVAWEPEFAACRPLLKRGPASVAPQNPPQGATP